MKKLIKYGLAYGFLICLFTFNIWLINQGSGFTVPRELLFRTYAPVWKPILAFAFILPLFFFLYKILRPTIEPLSHKAISKIAFTLCVIFSFSLFFTVQTNPDFGTYFREIQYFINNGFIETIKDWGTFSCRHTLPVMPFLYSLSMSLFTNLKFAVLSINFILFVGLVYFLYKIGQKFFNRNIALISIILFSTTPFVVTQTDLMLVDLGLTFFLLSSFYFSWKSLNNPKAETSLLFYLTLTLATFTKVFGGFYLIIFFFSFLIYALIKKIRHLKFFLLPYFFSGLTALSYLIWKKEIYFSVFSQNNVLISIAGVLAVSLALVVLIKINLSRLKAINFGKFILPVFYCLIMGLFIFGGKNAFYLRTVFIGTNIIIGLLFYLSFYFVAKNKKYKSLLFYPWIFAVNFIPPNMFKHQLTTYPAIILLSVYSLFKIFKKRFIKVILVTVTFSISIIYFFFLPMIQKHVKNNLRETSRYLVGQNVKNSAVTFFPLGVWGERFEIGLTRKDKCPQPPSMVDMLTFFANDKINFEYIDNQSLLNLIEESGTRPSTVVVGLHMDVPTPGIDEYYEKLKKYYKEGQMFDQAKGSGIWRVKLQVWREK